MKNLGYIAPCFIVASLQPSLAFYVDKLGFEVLYSGPDEDPFWATVGRDGIAIMLKAIAPEVKPVPNPARHAWARWDAFIYAADPDALYREYQGKGAPFRQPIADDGDNLRGFEVQDADGYVLFFGRPVADAPAAI